MIKHYILAELNLYLLILFIVPPLLNVVMEIHILILQT